GDDTYVFSGNMTGDVVVDDPYQPDASGADNSVDTLDFSGFTTGPVSVDLGTTARQKVSSGDLYVTFSDTKGIENLTGTAFGDTLVGNDRNNDLRGADLLDDRAGVAPGWNGKTQVVLLDFDTYTNRDPLTGPQDQHEHFYMAQERAAVQSRIEADYQAFGHF